MVNRSLRAAKAIRGQSPWRPLAYLKWYMPKPTIDSPHSTGFSPLTSAIIEQSARVSRLRDSSGIAARYLGTLARVGSVFV